MEVKINDRNVQLLLDTGAMRSLLSEEEYLRSPETYGQALIPTRAAQGPCGERLHVIGETSPLQITFLGCITTIQFLILRKLDVAGIMGLDLLMLGSTSINLETMVISSSHTNVSTRLLFKPIQASPFQSIICSGIISTATTEYNNSSSYDMNNSQLIPNPNLLCNGNEETTKPMVMDSNSLYDPSINSSNHDNSITRQLNPNSKSFIPNTQALTASNIHNSNENFPITTNAVNHVNDQIPETQNTSDGGHNVRAEVIDPITVRDLESKVATSPTATSHTVFQMSDNTGNVRPQPSIPNPDLVVGPQDTLPTKPDLDSDNNKLHLYPQYIRSKTYHNSFPKKYRYNNSWCMSVEHSRNSLFQAIANLPNPINNCSDPPDNNPINNGHMNQTEQVSENIKMSPLANNSFSPTREQEKTTSDIPDSTIPNFQPNQNSGRQHRKPGSNQTKPNQHNSVSNINKLSPALRYHMLVDKEEEDRLNQIQKERRAAMRQSFVQADTPRPLMNIDPNIVVPTKHNTRNEKPTDRGQQQQLPTPYQTHTVTVASQPSINSILLAENNLEFAPHQTEIIELDHRPSTDAVFHIHPVLSTFLECKPTPVQENQQLRVALTNITDEKQTIPSNTQIGHTEPVEPPNTDIVFPWEQTPHFFKDKPEPNTPMIPTHLLPSEAEQLETLCSNFSEMFATNPTHLGQTTMGVHTIQTTGRPIRQAPRRKNLIMRDEEDRQVGMLLDMGIITKSKSPWASPALLVKKRDGSHRFCVDYRKLNSVTIKDAHPIPRIDDALDAMKGAKYFSTLDLQQGYFQVPLAEQDRYKTAFCTSRGDLWEFTVMPMGVCNGPATFSRLMDAVLENINWRFCIAYLDDIIIFSNSYEEHIAHLTEVFNRLQNAGLLVKPSKCKLAHKEVDFLGHVVGEFGVRANPDKTKSIQDQPPPTNVKQTRSFLGLASYYRRFVQGFSTIAKPLYNLLEKKRKWEWTQACQSAFDELKERLTSAPIMGYPDFSESRQPFKLYTDASNVGVGAVLAQPQDGKERVIAYASRTLNKAETNYSTTQKELLAIVWAVKYFKHYLIEPFQILTDHHSLQWLHQMEHGSALFNRWRNDLQSFTYTIHFKNGRLQGHVDALSRLPLEEIPLGQDKIHMIRTEQTPLNSGEQHQEELRQLRDAATGESHPTFLPKDWKNKLTLVNGAVINGAGAQVLGPLTGTEIMTAMHNSPGSHLGSKKLASLFRERYWMPGVTTVAKDIVKNCEACQKSKDYGPRKIPPGTTGARRPWHILAVDIMGPLEPSQGYRYVVTIIDCFSRYLIAVPTKDHTAKTVAQVLLTRAIAQSGVPEILLSDRGTEFTGTLWNELANLMGYKLRHTAPYHPQSNGICERSHRTINNAIRATKQQHTETSWPEIVPLIQMHYNATTHASTGYSPHEVLYGHRSRLPIHHVLSPTTQPNEEEAHSDFLTEKRKLLKTIYDEILEDKQIEPPPLNPYTPGDYIYARCLPLTGRTKLDLKWEGPFQVATTPSGFQVTYYNREGIIRRRHVNDVKPADINRSPTRGKTTDLSPHTSQEEVDTETNTPIITLPVQSKPKQPPEPNDFLGFPDQETNDFLGFENVACVNVHKSPRQTKSIMSHSEEDPIEHIYTNGFRSFPNLSPVAPICLLIINMTTTKHTPISHSSPSPSSISLPSPLIDLPFLHSTAPGKVNHRTKKKRHSPGYYHITTRAQLRKTRNKLGLI